MKYFIVTVDTEGDNQWNYKTGDPVSTQNADYIPRFQDLCEKYGMRPVYLINYEMAQNSRFMEYVSSKAHKGLCEVGMHLHAWSMPPEYDLREGISQKQGLPYLIEYPDQIMEEKIVLMTETIYNATGIKPVSHRAGRWAMDQRYFDLLARYGYVADCSATPNVSWWNCLGYSADSHGTDYSKVENKPYKVSEYQNNSLYEVPMSISKPIRYLSIANGMKQMARNLIKGRNIWMRLLDNSDCPVAIKSYIKNNNSDYLMFMLHSSELMPGCSKYFQTPVDVENFFINMENVFRQVVTAGYKGIDLKGYVEEWICTSRL